MKQTLDRIFVPSNNRLKLMTHLVAGFPSFEINLACAKAMELHGADLIEVQLPFSDPIADGPTIMKANQTVINRGVVLQEVFDFFKQLVATVSVPVLIMTYYNIPYRMGLENFFKQAERLGVSGLIIPDLPFDNQQENFLSRIASYDLHPVMVVSPTISEERLEQLSHHTSGLLYTTLRVGITGTRKEIEPSSQKFLQKLKQKITVPIAAGFGISSSKQMVCLRDLVEVAVIGSKIIELFQEYPSDQAILQMSDFLSDCKHHC